MFFRLSVAAALLCTVGSSRAEDPKEIRRETDTSDAVRVRLICSVADLRSISHKVKLNEAGEVVAVRMLCHSQATDDKLTLLQQFPTIERLDLAGSFGLTDAGLKQLHKLPKLRQLCIMSEEVTDAGLKHLAQNSELQTVELSTPKVTAAGVAELKRLLPKVSVTVEE